jgi:hypothetical protein
VQDFCLLPSFKSAQPLGLRLSSGSVRVCPSTFVPHRCITRCSCRRRRTAHRFLVYRGGAEKQHVGFLMRTSALIFTLCLPIHALAAECGESGARHWTTIEKFGTDTVTLHWTGVYEGRDSVCAISYTQKGKKVSVEAWGQPILNREQSLIALLSCADDGCRREITVWDVNTQKILKAELPVKDSQFYLKASWRGVSRTLDVEIEGEPRPIICSIEKALVCQRAESN